MNRFFKFLILLIVFVFPVSAVADNLKISYLDGTVCKVSADRVAARLDLTKTLKSTDTIVTVDKNSKAILNLENLKIELHPRTKLHFKQVVFLEKNIYVLCSLIQGKLTLELSKSSEKLIKILIDTRNSTIVTTSDNFSSFLVISTGKVTVQQGIVEVYRLKYWTEANFTDKAIQREPPILVFAGESCYLNYTSSLKDYPKKPKELPKRNYSYLALPVDEETGKIQTEEQN